MKIEGSPAIVLTFLAILALVLMLHIFCLTYKVPSVAHHYLFSSSDLKHIVLRCKDSIFYCILYTRTYIFPFLFSITFHLFSPFFTFRILIAFRRTIGANLL